GRRLVLVERLLHLVDRVDAAQRQVALKRLVVRAALLGPLLRLLLVLRGAGVDLLDLLRLVVAELDLLLHLGEGRQPVGAPAAFLLVLRPRHPGQRDADRQRHNALPLHGLLLYKGTYLQTPPGGIWLRRVTRY